MDRERELRDLEILARWLDSRFRMPGTNIRFGLDAIIGLVPGIGDGLLAIPSGYIVMRAHRMGAPKSVLVRMGLNVGIDFLIGVVTVIGDLFDVGFRANQRNVALLRAHFDQEPKTSA